MHYPDFGVSGPARLVSDRAAAAQLRRAQNGIDIGPETGDRGFATALGRCSYDTAFLGEVHFATTNTFAPTGTPECVHSVPRFDASWYGHYMGFKHVELMMLGHWFKHSKHAVLSPRGQHFERWVFEEAGFSDMFELSAAETRLGVGAAETRNSALLPELHSSIWCADRAIDWLRVREAGMPFCAWFSFPDPLHPFDCLEAQSGLDHPDEVYLPVEGRKNLDRRPRWHRAALDHEPDLADPALRSFRDRSSRVPDRNERDLREMTVNYDGMVALIDHSLGHIVVELDNRGLRDSTIVIDPTEHDDLLGDHVLYLKGPTPYEALLRVDLIVRGPGSAAGRRVTNPVSTVDRSRTFGDYAGTTLGDVVQSRSLRDLLDASQAARRDVAYSEWNVDASRCGVALQLRTMRSLTAMLARELGSGAGELYDRVNDPYEMDNRFGDTGPATLQREFVEMARARSGTVLEHFDAPVAMA